MLIIFSIAENKKLAKPNLNNQVQWKELIKHTANKAVLSSLSHLCHVECEISFSKTHVIKNTYFFFILLDRLEKA